MKTEYVKRYLFFFIGLFIMSIGVAFSIKANLGTSPISSVPYVLSLIMPMTVGALTIAMHCVFILLQVLILRENYQPVQLMQLPVAVAFGMMIDFAVWLLGGTHCSSYLMQWIFCAIGIVMVAIGVSIEVTANVVTLAGEGLVLAICKVAPVKFSSMKVCLDCVLVLIAALIGLFAKGTLLGIREGTIAAASFVGLLSKPICKPVMRLMDRMLDTGRK
jgi:uncharacterized membrane protein YczE